MALLTVLTLPPFLVMTATCWVVGHPHQRTAAAPRPPRTFPSPNGEPRSCQDRYPC